MRKGQTIYQIQQGNTSAEQYGIRIEDIDTTHATLRSKYAGAKPFKVRIAELHSKYTASNLTEQAQQTPAPASSAAPTLDSKQKVNLDNAGKVGKDAADGSDTPAK